MSTEDCEGVEDRSGEGAILLVEDEPHVLEILRQILESAGFTVLPTHDGREAVELFETRQHDIAAVLMDMKMPGMDGTEAFAELRRTKVDVPILLMSGYTDRATVESLLAQGRADLIEKPFEMDELIQRLRNLLLRSD